MVTFVAKMSSMYSNILFLLKDLFGISFKLFFNPYKVLIILGVPMLKFGVYEVCCCFLQSSVSFLYEKHNNAMQCDVM